MTRSDAAAFIPLKPDFFHILLALAEQDRHGYGIIRTVEEATGGAIVMEPSPLYRRLRRLLEDGIIRETEAEAHDGHEDERRRYYHLTPLGRQVLALEAARLVELAESNTVRRLATTARVAG